MIQNYCIVDIATNIVVNVCVWDGDTNTWQPPAGTIAVQSDTAGIGWIYDPATQTFTDPNSPAPEPTP